MVADQGQYRKAMTPEYAAPEQRRGAPPDRRSDLYALGLVLLQLMDGMRPSERRYWPQEAVTMLVEHGRSELVTGGAVEPVPAALGHLLRGCLAEKPEDRYQDAGRLAADLQRLCHAFWPVDEAVSTPMSFRYDLLLWHEPADAEAVHQLAARLRDVGLAVWPEPEDTSLASDHHAAATAALEQARGCAVCLSAVPDGAVRLFDEAVSVRDHLAFRCAFDDFQLLPLLLPGAAYPTTQRDLPVFLQHRAWIELTGDGDDTVRIYQAFCAGLAASQPTPLETGVCPFRGLAAFREEDADHFFGREALCRRIEARLKTQPFLAVVGPSGIGKSSVIQAGVLPRLRCDGHPIAVMTPGEDPLQELAFALSSLGDESPLILLERLRRSPDALRFIARELIGGAAETDAAPRRALVLVIDQFEELFTLTRLRNARAAFVSRLCHAVAAADTGLTIVLSMRSDFLGKCAGYPDLNRLVSEHFIQVSAMNRNDLATTIEQQARAGGLRLEPGLARLILDDVAHAEVELPLVEHALLELYERRQAGSLTLAAYTEIGGIEGALAGRAESEYAALDGPAREILRKMFTLCLIHPGEGAQDTRRRTPRRELLALAQTPQTVEHILEQWTGKRLLTCSDSGGSGGEMVDVAHEALIHKWARIGDWMAEDREAARQLQRIRLAATAWQEAGRDSDHLLRGRPLHHAESLPENFLGELERDFVAAGIAARDALEAEREARQRAEVAAARRLGRRRTIGATLFVAAAVCVGLIFLDQRHQTQTQRKLAQAEQATAVAVKDFLIDMFDYSDPDANQGEVMDVFDALDHSARRIVANEDLPATVKAELQAAMGTIYINLGRYQEAHDVLENAVQLHNDQTFASFDRAIAHSSLANVAIQRNQFEEAEALLNKASQILEQAGEAAPEAWNVVHREFGWLRQRQGDWDGAKHHYTQAMVFVLEHYGPDSDEEAVALEGLGLVARKQGDFETAFTHFQKALAIHLRLYGDQNQKVANDRQHVGSVLWDMGRYDAAKTQLHGCLMLREKLLPSGHIGLGAIHGVYGMFLADSGAYKEAEQHIGTAVAIAGDQLGAVHWITGFHKSNLAEVIRLQARPQEALVLIEEAQAVIKETLPADHAKSYVAQSIRGACLADLNRGTEVESLLRESAVVLIEKDGWSKRSTRKAVGRLVDFYQTRQRPEEATLWQARLEQRE